MLPYSLLPARSLGWCPESPFGRLRSRLELRGSRLSCCLFLRELYRLLGHLLSAEEEGKCREGSLSGLSPAPPAYLPSPLMSQFLGWDLWVDRRGAEGSRCLGWGWPHTDLGSCWQRSCSNCGNSFCSRCCSFKVPKSSMGATGEWCRRLGVRAGGGRGWFPPLRRCCLWDRSEGQ